MVAPCHQCLQAGNNGHFWMFHSDACQPQERKDISGKKMKEIYVKGKKSRGAKGSGGEGGAGKR